MIYSNPARFIFIVFLVGFFLPTFAGGATLLSNLASRADKLGILALDADGNGQTYFIHFASGKKYYTGQVTAENGQALADNSAWLGMSKENLDSIPTGGGRPVVVYGELPDTLHNPLEPINQGLYGTCVSVTIARIGEGLYGTPLSAMQLHAEIGARLSGVQASKAHHHTRTVGLIAEEYNPYDSDPWTLEEWRFTPIETDSARYMLTATMVDWSYRGTVEEIEDMKHALVQNRYLSANIDTVQNWDEGAIYSGDEYRVNHMMTIAGWDERGWIVYNSYGEGAGTMRFDYPLRWVYSYE